MIVSLISSLNLAQPRSVNSFSTKPAQFLRPLSPDSFIRFGQAKTEKTLRIDPVFKANELTPTIATDADLYEVAKILSKMPVEQDYSIENMRLASLKRSDEELKNIFRTKADKGDEGALDVFINWYKSKLKDFETFKQFSINLNKTHTSAESLKNIYPDLRKRWTENPQGALLVVKNKENKIIAIEGINQFQKSHELISQGDTTGLDPKCGLLSYLWVDPEYRNRGIASALKKTAIAYSVAHLGYRYLFSPTEAENKSHIINQHLGYIPVTEDTQLENCPAFTKEMLKNLINEYNVGSRQLCYLDLSSEALKKILAVEESAVASVKKAA